MGVIRDREGKAISFDQTQYLYQKYLNVTCTSPKCGCAVFKVPDKYKSKI
jgi:hypothetical protein